MELRTFIITSDEFEGEIIAQFADDTDLLMSIDYSKAKLSKLQYSWFMDNENTPKSISTLNRWIREKRKLKIEEEKITFEKFWDAYGDKICSSRKKTLAKWNKMPISEQGKAYRFIGRYLASLGQGIRQKYAETYLNSEIWNN